MTASLYFISIVNKFGSENIYLINILNSFAIRRHPDLSKIKDPMPWLFIVEDPIKYIFSCRICDKDIVKSYEKNRWDICEDIYSHGIEHLKEKNLLPII